MGGGRWAGKASPHRGPLRSDHLIVESGVPLNDAWSGANRATAGPDAPVSPSRHDLGARAAVCLVLAAFFLGGCSVSGPQTRAPSSPVGSSGQERDEDASFDGPATGGSRRVSGGESEAQPVASASGGQKRGKGGSSGGPGTGGSRRVSKGDPEVPPVASPSVDTMPHDRYGPSAAPSAEPGPASPCATDSACPGTPSPTTTATPAPPTSGTASPGPTSPPPSS